MSIKKTLGIMIGVPFGLLVLAVTAMSIHTASQTPEEQAKEHCYLELPNGDPYGEEKNCENAFLIQYYYDNAYKPKYK